MGSRLLEGVGEAGDELEGVCLVAGRGVVEVVVGGREGGAEAFPGGEYDADGGHRGIGLRVVPGGDVGGGLREDDLAWEVSVVGLAEDGTDEVDFGLGEEGLALVVDVGLQIKLLLLFLDGRPADAAAVELLKIKALGEVVVEGGVRKRIETRSEVPVAFGVGVEDAAEGGDGGGGGEGLGNKSPSFN